MSSKVARVSKPTTWVAYAYGLLAGLRVLSALRGYGYIHPDEWMQSGEPLLALVHSVAGPQTTWEWEPSQAIRSPTSLSHASFPLGLLLHLWPGVWSGHQLFLLQRSSMLIRSFAIDAAIRLLFPGEAAQSMSCLLAISTSVTVFLARPFSNAFEAQMLAICFACVLSLHAKFSHASAEVTRKDVGRLIFLGLCVAESFFARFTFAIFVLPLGLFFAAMIWSVGPRRAALFLGVTAVSFGIACANIVSEDTHLYTQLGNAKGVQVATSLGTRWVIAPVNALLYNLRTENVAQHGLHPRWLHVCVNMPLMFGISTCYAVAVQLMTEVQHFAAQKPTARKAAQLLADPERTAVRLSLATITFSLAVLSISPHQEPRFLLPLVLPCAIVFSYTLRSAHFTARPRLSKLLVALYVAQHAFQLVFFGFAHQGGLLPALFAVDEAAAQGSGKQVVFWRTFNVPFHLMPRIGRNVKVHPFSGSSKSPVQVYETIALACDRTSLVLPAYAVADMYTAISQSGNRVRLEQQRAFWPHIDTDHFGEMAATAREHGWMYATSLHLLQVRCNHVDEPATNPMSASPAPVPLPPGPSQTTAPPAQKIEL